LLGLGGEEADGALSAGADGEEDHAVDVGEEGEVTPHAHVVSGVELGPDLANDDVASADDLTAKPLYAAALTAGIATVAR
jgi:hypothetical protein